MAKIVGTENFKYPRVTIRHLDYSGEYKKLASYLIKIVGNSFMVRKRCIRNVFVHLKILLCH